MNQQKPGDPVRPGTVPADADSTSGSGAPAVAAAQLDGFLVACRSFRPAALMPAGLNQIAFGRGDDIRHGFGRTVGFAAAYLVENRSVKRQILLDAVALGGLRLLVQLE